MCLFIEKALRGVFLTLLKDTVKEITNTWKNCDPTKPSIYILYLDMNNLYGWAMNGYLPYGGFKWLKNVDNFDVNLISEKRIESRSWSRISWRIACIAKWLSISSRKTCNSLWHTVKLL